MKISQQDLKTIYGDDYHFFAEKIINNCFCSKCRTPYTSTIINYEIFLSEINDTILKGFCSVCGSQINRYLETGEVQEYVPKIKLVKKKYEN